MDTVMRLKNVPLFAALTPENLARVAEIASRRTYPKGSLLCREEDLSRTLYIIDSGEAIQRQTDPRGAERPSGYLRPGDLVGDDALLLGDAYGYCIQATADVDALCIRRADFDLLLHAYPEIHGQLRPRPLIRERLQVRALPGQDKDEPWLLRRQRHWFFFVRSLLTPLLALAALAAAVLVLGLLGVTMPSRLAFLLVSAVPSALVVWAYMDWQNDYYLVTTKRLLHREQVLLKSESREEAPLTKVQNISIKQRLGGKLLGFATLHVQTAGARGLMILDYLRDPEGMQEVIFKQISYLKSKSTEEARGEIRQELEARIGKDQTAGIPIFPLPPEEPPPRTGFLARFRLNKPLLSVRYAQEGRVTWRKHRIFLIRRIWLLLPVFLLSSAAIPFIIFSAQLGSYRLSALLASLVIWIALFFWLWWEVTDWRNDEYIVTTRSIIDINKKPLFVAGERKEAPLDMIQNVSLKQEGLLATILNYGDVLIQTAGPGAMFTFDGVPRPIEVQREIFRRIEEFTEMRQRRERDQRHEELATWFDVYHERTTAPKPPGAV